MATLLIEMPSGIAGDMLLAALIDLGADIARIQAGLDGLGVGPLPLIAESAAPGGIRASRVKVAVPQTPDWNPAAGSSSHDEAAHEHRHTGDLGQNHSHDHAHAHAHAHEHSHRPYAAIRELLATADLPERVRQRAQVVFRLLAEAEGAVHGVPPEAVHFHEVGSLDAIADVVGCCLALEVLGVDRVIAGPLTLGNGHVHCAHGRMPVPVPAVLAMLERRPAPCRRLPQETGELTTPTGAALVLGLAECFDLDLVGAPLQIGYGAGSKTIPGLTNLLRTSLVTTDDQSNRDEIVELRCCLDDCSGEALAVLQERLLERGARDVWLHAIVMKKGRPGHEVVVLAAPEDEHALSDELLLHSGSLGLRRQRLERRLSARWIEHIELADTPIAIKVRRDPDGRLRGKAEAADIANLARSTGQPFAALAQQALAIWQARPQQA